MYKYVHTYMHIYVHTYICIYISMLCICNYFLFTLMKVMMSFIYERKESSRSWCPVSNAERSTSSKGLGLLGYCVLGWKGVCARSP